MDDAALAPWCARCCARARSTCSATPPARAVTRTGIASSTRRTPAAETLHRTLLWTIYLNDDFHDGETEFLYQERKIVPRTGCLLIAPTAFTHTHRGNRPRGGDKYIATSWILFQRAETLFAPG